MRLSKAWVFIGMSLMMFMYVRAEAGQPESAVLEGSRWALVNIDSDFGNKRKDVIFHEEGLLEILDPNPNVVVTPGDDYWELNGKKIFLRVNDGYSVYEGEILDEQTMGGMASNRAGLRWEWRAHSDLGASVGEAPPEQIADAHDRSSVPLQQPQVQAVEEPSNTQQPGQPKELADMNGAETARIELSVGEPMSEEDVRAAIDSGKAKKKFKHIGLERWDFSGYTDHSVWIYTPRAWVELQSFTAAKNHREVSLTEADVQPVLRVRANPWAVPREPGSSDRPCRLLLGVVLEDESRKSVLRPETEDKNTVQMKSKYEWGTVSCVGILATFSMSKVDALRAMSPDAEFLVTVSVDADGTPTERVWQVRVKDFKKLP